MRSNTLDAARRAFLGVVRGVLMKADDSKLMQAVDVRHLHNERNPTVERFQNYGFSSVPLPPDQDGRKAAESLTVFANGNRSHPIVIAIDDRRHRPKNLKEGESLLYDDQGQQVYLTRNGIKFVGGNSKLPVNVDVGNATLTVADGKITGKVNKTAVVVTDGMVYLGGDPADGGSFDFVQTVSAPATNTKAKL